MTLALNKIRRVGHLPTRCASGRTYLYNRMKMKKYYLLTTEHLEDKLWFRETEDFAVGMNHVALQAVLSPKVLVLAFILMSNHVHFVLSGMEPEVRDFVNGFKSRYSLYLYRKYGSRGQLRYNDLDVKGIPIEEVEALERAVAYVQMNCVAAGICAHPSQYAWGTGNAFFNAVGAPVQNASVSGVAKGIISSARPLSEFSGRARIRLMHSNLALSIPEDWLVSEAGFVLPESYVAVDLVERLFRSPGRMNYFLNASSKARKRLEAEDDRLPAFKDQLILQALPDLLKGIFGKVRFEDLASKEDQAETIRQIRYRFSANIHQAARVCGISYDEAARLMDSV